MHLNSELQHATRGYQPTTGGSGDLTVTSIRQVIPTPVSTTTESINATAEFMVVPRGVRGREATERINAPTIDIGMTTGHDIVEDQSENGDASPFCYQLVGNVDNDDGLETRISPIKEADSTLSVTPLRAAKVAASKLTEGFEGAFVVNPTLSAFYRRTIKPYSIPIVQGNDIFPLQTSRSRWLLLLLHSP